MSAGIAGQLSLYDLLDSPSPEPAGLVEPEIAEPEIGLDGEIRLDGEIELDGDLVLDGEIMLDGHLAPGDEIALGGQSVPTLPRLEVEVTRSRRRKKTADAQLSGTVLRIRIPALCSADEERYFIDHFSEKFERSRAASVLDLEERAKSLARTHELPRPRSIRWVSNQKHQWGSCTPSEGSIRLSDRMAGFPAWVVDYVIVHELAHLVEADHGRAFWALVNRYPKTERARGYLLAKDGV
jgi:predicted metal-dependent hydrolase